MKRSVVCLFATLGGLLFCSPGLSQVAQPPAYPVPAPAGRVTAAQPNFVPSYNTVTGTTIYAPAGGPGAALSAEVAQLVKQLEEAEDSSKKAEITKQLETAVGKAF